MYCSVTFLFGGLHWGHRVWQGSGNQVSGIRFQEPGVGTGGTGIGCRGVWCFGGICRFYEPRYELAVRDTT